MMGKWKKITLLVAFAGLIPATLVAKDDSKTSRDYDLKKARFIAVTKLDTVDNGYDKTYTLPNEDLSELEAQKLDSMVNTWYVQNAFEFDSLSYNTLPDSLKKALPDSVYINRLQDINSYIDLSFNNTVKNFITLYTIKRRDQVKVMLGLANYYFPIFEQILDKYNLPLELKYMAIIESALNPRAFSRAGACGLWQFMYGTGKMLGLEINSFVDERRDPVKSTEAAAKYLQDLYNIYGDWHLVIAAYNCGPGNVNKAIRRSGGTKNYWKIYYHLPRETRGYVPAFIAAAYVMNYAKEHHLAPTQPSFDIVTDTIQVHNYLNFQQVSAVLNIPVEELRDLNPQYRRDIIPATAKKAYTLKIPANKTSDFIDKESFVFAYNRDKFFPNNKIVVPSRHYSYFTPGDVAGKDKVYYTVKRGDNVGFIAEWFHVRASQVRYWNNIHRNLIRVGQKLVIYVPKGKGAHYKQYNSMTFAQKQSGKVPANRAVQSTVDTDGPYTIYTVRRGDNLWTIARKYPGVSNFDIMKMNGIKDAKSLKPGQRIKIPTNA
ncbi:lytic transglycosylase domain-containing protein [Prolixibacter sp. NT017]|uniref:lytic transglycosylase domain-containing protein n=1 Tax=Prolixibacter sp. NT017 TaxID=2652390 RepID=UPI00126C5A45|nr:lytic transglycosylase domain-containing protein [Prolixibacter sp. NT017]GET26627.1 hypothetical protein NT017_29560 [Prolixibacter sp. NT017]